MIDIIAAAFEYAGVRRIPTDREILVWCANLPAELRARVDAITQEVIDAAEDADAAMAATEAGCLALAPIILRRPR